jgi:two-component system chemotaxis response regulator CheY
MTRRSVLIVDDHEAFRFAARALLARGNFDVVGDAADGQDALAAAARLRPDVVLLDIRLPDIDGFEVARRLADSASPPAVVLVSTLGTGDVGSRVAWSGARGFVTKSRLSADKLRRLLDGSEEEGA